MEIKKRIEILETMLARREIRRGAKILLEKIAGYFDSDEHEEMTVLVLTIYDYKKIANEQFIEEYRSRGYQV